MFFAIDDLENALDTKPDEDFVAIIPANKANHYDIINYYIPKIPLLLWTFIFLK